MGSIHYLSGDATSPIGEGNKVICHICNDIGGWGAGFVLALSGKWAEPETEYRKWSKDKASFKLGNVQFVKVEDDIVVANMIGQHLTFPVMDANGNITQPIRYDSLRECLEKVADYAIRNKCLVHMPKIGAGLAGGDWNIIEGIINDTLPNNGVETYVYLFE